MKNSIIYSLLLVLCIVPACRKSDNPSLPPLYKVPLPIIAKDPSGDAVISGQDPDAFQGKYTVGLYFQRDAQPKKFDIVAIKNGNTSIQKIIQADVTAFPSTLSVTGPQLAAAFGEAIAVGDFFDIGINVTIQTGQTFEAFPAVGVPYDGNVNNQPGVNFTIRYTAVCQYDPSIYNGDFEVVLDEWQDYQPGDIVPITQIDDTHFSFMYNALDAQPIIVTVDPATNETFVADQYYGNYGPDFGDFSAHSVPGNVDNYVAPCNEVFSIVLDHSSTVFGDLGTARIELKKK